MEIERDLSLDLPDNPDPRRTLQDRRHETLRVPDTHRRGTQSDYIRGCVKEHWSPLTNVNRQIILAHFVNMTCKLHLIVLAWKSKVFEMIIFIEN